MYIYTMYINIHTHTYIYMIYYKYMPSSFGATQFWHILTHVHFPLALSPKKYLWGTDGCSACARGANGNGIRMTQLCMGQKRGILNQRIGFIPPNGDEKLRMRLKGWNGCYFQTKNHSLLVLNDMFWQGHIFLTQLEDPCVGTRSFHGM